MCQSHSFYFYIQLKTSTGDLLRARRPYFGEIWGWPLYFWANLCVLEHQQETRHTPTCNQAWPGFLCKDADCSKGNSTQGHLESPFAVRTRRGGTSLGWELWVVGSGCGECRSVLQPYLIPWFPLDSLYSYFSQSSRPQTGQIHTSERSEEAIESSWLAL